MIKQQKDLKGNFDDGHEPLRIKGVRRQKADKPDRQSKTPKDYGEDDEDEDLPDEPVN
jgi:hypothetical protein